MKIAILATAAPLAAAPTPARTQEGAQANGLPLSEILARIEAQADFAAVQSVEWHDRQWEIDCRKTDGAQVEVKIDPATGEPSTRCGKARTTVCLDDSGPKCPAPWTTGHAGQGV